MLGWSINVWRQIDPPDTPARTRRGFVAGWEAGLGGLDWLDALVAGGRAVALGGNGYPLSYELAAAELAAAIGGGPPRHEGPLVIGEDYVRPGGWVGEFELDRPALAACPPGEVLRVEAWDQS